MRLLVKMMQDVLDTLVFKIKAIMYPQFFATIILVVWLHSAAVHLSEFYQAMLLMSVISWNG